MHSHFTVIFDACVFYPVHLRDILVQLATTGLFRARWTDEIHEEWTRNLAINRPDIGQDKLNQMRSQMNCAVPDSLVMGYEPLIDGLNLPDPNDRHVLAAAIRCHAAVIVTTNRKDFPDELLEPFGVIAQHPDVFITDLIDLDAGAVCKSVKLVRARKKDPAITPEGQLEILQGQGLPETVSELRGFIDLL